MVEKVNHLDTKKVYIKEENLGGKVAGYLNTSFGERLIHVNSELPERHKLFVINHFILKAVTDNQLYFLATQRFLNDILTEN